MLDRRHHKWILFVGTLFIVAWALWSFIWLPMAETPGVSENPPLVAPGE